MKDVIILVSHKLNKILVEKYLRIKRQISNYGDVFILLNKENNITTKIPENINCQTFTVDMLNDLGYDPICETIIPGSNHFALLWFYLKNPNYRYYWNIEYDVEFSGKWDLLLNNFTHSDADFISTHIKRYYENIDWPWWSSYKGVSLEIPFDKRLSSFNPIFRISNLALRFLDDFLKKGNSGHHEVLIPSVLFYCGFKIMDFGGDGTFTSSNNIEKFYITSDILADGISSGTMRYRPVFDEIKKYQLPNKLFHPLKCDVRNAQLKVLAIVVTYNGEETIKECIDSLLKSELALSIFIIDNASTDNTLSILKQKYPMIIIIENKKNIGFGQANNIGFKYAKENQYDYVFLLNQDAYIEKDTIFNLVKVQNNNPQYDLLSPLHYSRDLSTLDRKFFRYIQNGCPNYIMDLITKKTIKEVYPSHFINAAAWLLTLDCINKIGGFDPIFFHTGEDVDYCNRLIFNKYSICIVPSTKIYHLRSNEGKIPQLNDYYFHKYIYILVDIKNPSLKKSLKSVVRELLSEMIYRTLCGKLLEAKKNGNILCKIWKEKKKLSLKNY
jgi:GT2 family glycosyltransferase